MKEIIKVTSRASNQIKKIISEAPFTTEGIVVGLDNLNHYYDIDLKKSRLKILKKGIHLY